ncbi:MAG TPA: hypothetical protein VFJ58_09980 [Armatimonadota bacterium]|nr:hypothetical protein [Armatimonadota bacterium]
MLVWVPEESHGDLNEKRRTERIVDNAAKTDSAMEQIPDMISPILEIEGTWDEIKARVPDFEGKRLRVTVRVAEDPAGEALSPLDAALVDIWSNVPDESWDQFPADFGDNLDHYLYGTPRRQ